MNFMIVKKWSSNLPLVPSIALRDRKLLRGTSCSRLPWTLHKTMVTRSARVRKYQRNICIFFNEKRSFHVHLSVRWYFYDPALLAVRFYSYSSFSSYSRITLKFWSFHIEARIEKINERALSLAQINSVNNFRVSTGIRFAMSQPQGGNFL